MNVLIIGGTGTISQAVVQRSIEMGMDVTVLNRGHHNQVLPKGVKQLIGDIHQEDTIKTLLNGHFYDCVIDFIAFTQNHIERDVRLFKDKTNQYIFISSASVYQKPMVNYPITEGTPRHNPYWSYSRDKIACEVYLENLEDFTYTIVRPSHTYNEHMIMAPVIRWGFEYAHIKRLKEGKPVIIPGDGSSLWTITHALDFAQSFIDLIGNHKAYNRAYHITAKKLYTWDQLTQMTAQALGVKAHIIHIPTDIIIKYLPELEGPLLGDKTWSAIFDNTKIQSITQNYQSSIGYEDVVHKVVEYYQNHPEKQMISQDFEKIYDQIINMYGNI